MEVYMTTAPAGVGKPPHNTCSPWVLGSTPFFFSKTQPPDSIAISLSEWAGAVLTIWVRKSVNEPLPSPSRMSPQQQSRCYALEPRFGLSTNTGWCCEEIGNSHCPSQTNSRRAGSLSGPADLEWRLEPIRTDEESDPWGTDVVRDGYPQEARGDRKKWGVLKGNLDECGLKERNQTVPERWDNLSVFWINSV